LTSRPEADIADNVARRDGNLTLGTADFGQVCSSEPLRVLVIAALALTALTGCASMKTGTSPSSGDRRDWAYTPAGRGEPAKLAFGLPDSDDVDLLLWCDAANRQVRFTPVGDNGARFEHLTLQSGRQRLELDLSQDTRFGSVAAAPLDAPLVAAFRSSYRLRMIVAGKRLLDLDATAPKGRQQIRYFFVSCRQASHL
jgi:hypothetical protein